MPISSRWRTWQCKAARIVPSSGFPTPSWKAASSSASPARSLRRLTPVPSDKILFPRRMLYVEAVLYVTVAAAAFGLGYLAGRGGSSAAGKEDADVQMRGQSRARCCWARVRARSGATRGPSSIVLPAGKLPDKRLPIAGLRPDDPPPAKGDATSAALAKFGGAAARTDASGDFTLFVPAAGSYRILIISRQATREPDGPLERSDISELGKYFDAPADLLQRLPLSLADEGPPPRRQADRGGVHRVSEFAR